MAPFLDKGACHMRNYIWKPKLPNGDSNFGLPMGKSAGLFSFPPFNS